MKVKKKLHELLDYTDQHQRNLATIQISTVTGVYTVATGMIGGNVLYTAGAGAGIVGVGVFSPFIGQSL